MVFLLFRSLDEVKDGGSGPKISSVSGANRKRKWEEEEEEDEEPKKEESSEDETSSEEEEEDEDEGNNSTETSKLLTAAKSEQEVKVEQNDVDPDKQRETITDQNTVQSKRLSEPAVFIPVNRSAEVQVRGNPIACIHGFGLCLVA